MADHRHKRETNARRLPRAALMAAPISVLTTLIAVSLGVASGPTPTTTVVKDSPALAAGAIGEVAGQRGEAVTRSLTRTVDVPEVVPRKLVSKKYQTKLLAGVAQVETKRAIRNAETELWTTEDLELWGSSAKKARKSGEIKSGKKVLATGRSAVGRAEIVVDGEAAWVTEEFLSESEPIPGIGGTCKNGTSVRGVSQNIVKVHAAVCAAFPEITVYGTLRGGGGDHPRGKAVDIMISGARGQQVANFVRANAGALGVSYVIYSQHIWSVERGGEGWRGMSNRGSATANHFDHVHVSVF